MSMLVESWFEVGVSSLGVSHCGQRNDDGDDRPASVLFLKSVGGGKEFRYVFWDNSLGLDAQVSMVCLV